MSTNRKNMVKIGLVHFKILVSLRAEREETQVQYIASAARKPGGEKTTKVHIPLKR